ncbi:MAG: flagellar basal body-associated FliL family protein [Planctomyces sp.]|nr:flagellar basal body-associated FliL family protein [Planctomyces sp.]
MAAPAAKPGADEQAPAKKGPGLVVWILVAAVSAGAGFAVPMAMNSGHAAGDGESGHGKSDAHAPKTPVPSKPAFVEFGQLVVNLNDGRLSRYLRLKINLQVDSKHQKDVQDLIAENRLLLQDWLLSHLADKTMEEIRGAAGQNMMRREILEQFNSVLFPDGYDRIYAVRFEEFNVQ